MFITCPNCGRTAPLQNTASIPASIRCPQCKTTFAPAQEEPESSPPRPWYKDPILQFAIAFPIVALSLFGGYLYRNHSLDVQKKQILSMMVDADRHQAANDSRSAFEKYKLIVNRGDGWADPEVIRAVTEATTKRDKLQIVLKAELDREEALRRAQEEERNQLAQLKVQELAKARAREEAQKERLREEAELAKIKASMAGGAWVIKGGGQSDILRGLTIYIPRENIARSELDAAVSVMKKDDDFDQFGGYASRLLNFPIDEQVDLKMILFGMALS